MHILKITAIALLLSFGQQPTEADSSITPLQPQDRRIQQLEGKIDSLEAEINKHNLKEGFFQTDLATQTGIFTLFVLIIVSLGTWYNWSHVKRMKTDIEENIDTRLEQIRNDVEEHKSNHLILRRRLYGGLHNLFYKASRFEKTPYMKMAFLISSIGYTNDLIETIKQQELDKEEDILFKKGLSNMKIILKEASNVIDQVNKKGLKKILDMEMNGVKTIRELVDNEDSEIAQKAAILVGKLYAEIEHKSKYE